MGATTPKGYDLSTVHAAIPELGALAAFQQLGNPVSDPYLANMVQDGNFSIITDPDTVAVNDLVYGGNVLGKVTAILDDGAATDNRIQITLFTDRYKPNPGADPDANRVLTLDFLDNDEDQTDEKKYLNTTKLLSAGFVFIRPKGGVLEPSRSTIGVADGAGTANDTDTELVTVTLYDSNGVQMAAGGETVVIASTGSGTVESQTDVGDGTYTATVKNAVAETVTVTATLNGVTLSVEESIVFS